MGTSFLHSLIAAGKIYQHRPFRAGVITDVMGTGRVLTNTGTQLQRNGIYIPLGQIAYEDVVLPDIAEFTALAKVRIDQTTATAASATVFGNLLSASPYHGWQARTVVSGTMKYSLQAFTGGSLQVAIGDSFVPGETHWRGVHYDAANAMTMTKNGVVVATLTNAGAITNTNCIDGIQFGKRIGSANYNQMLVEDYILVSQRLTTAQEAVLYAELDSISYPTAVYEIRPPDYPTIKDGTPSFSLCCGNTTDKVAGILPATATAVERKKDTQMADYLQFTRTSSSKLDYGIQTGNQLNYEFEWDGDVYFDTDSVGQITEIVKIGDSATGVCWGLRKTATEKFQFIYGNESTVDFAYSVPSLGPLHIVLRREWVSGTTYDVKLWVNGSYVEKVTGTYAGTGNASAKTYIGYGGLLTNYLSGRIYYSNIYPHLRPVEKFQRDPFSKNLMLGWGIRANNTVNTVARDTDNVVTVVTGGATFKVNSGFGADGRLEKFLETTGAGATFYLRGIDNPDGITLYYRTTGALAWTEGDGTVGVTVAADGLFTMPATTQLLWRTL
jgi:hypothetical protein